MEDVRVKIAKHLVHRTCMSGIVLHHLLTHILLDTQVRCYIAIYSMHQKYHK